MAFQFLHYFPKYEVTIDTMSKSNTWGIRDLFAVCYILDNRRIPKTRSAGKSSQSQLINSFPSAVESAPKFARAANFRVDAAH